MLINQQEEEEKVKECFFDDYFKSHNKTNELDEELYISFSYQFNNSICYFINKTNGTKICQNTTEEKQNRKYILTNILNNCGITN